MAGRMEIITGKERRRRWSEAEKRELVAESYGAGSGVAQVARRHGVAESCLYVWRRQYGQAGGTPSVEAPRLIPVRVEESAAGGSTPASVSQPPSPRGVAPSSASHLAAAPALATAPPVRATPAATPSSSPIGPGAPSARTLVTLPDGTRIELEAGYPVAALKALMLVLRPPR